MASWDPSNDGMEAAEQLPCEERPPARRVNPELARRARMRERARAGLPLDSPPRPPPVAQTSPRMCPGPCIPSAPLIPDPNNGCLLDDVQVFREPIPPPSAAQRAHMLNETRRAMLYPNHYPRQGHDQGPSTGRRRFWELLAEDENIPRDQPAPRSPEPVEDGDEPEEMPFGAGPIPFSCNELWNIRPELDLNQLLASPPERSPPPRMQSAPASPYDSNVVLGSISPDSSPCSGPGSPWITFPRIPQGSPRRAEPRSATGAPRHPRRNLFGTRSRRADPGC